MRMFFISAFRSCFKALTHQSLALLRLLKGVITLFLGGIITPFERRYYAFFRIIMPFKRRYYAKFGIITPFERRYYAFF